MVQNLILMGEIMHEGLSISTVAPGLSLSAITSSIVMCHDPQRQHYYYTSFQQIIKDLKFQEILKKSVW